jgi:hypothetical protein
MWYNLAIYTIVFFYCVGLGYFLREYYDDPTMVSDEPTFWHHVLAVVVLIFWPPVILFAIVYEKAYGK